MKKKVKKKNQLIIILVLISILLIELAIVFIFTGNKVDEQGLSSKKPWWIFGKAECGDNKDNDNDGFCDFDGCYTGKGKDKVFLPPDPGCETSNDDSEEPDCSTFTEICDGKDNNCDGLIDGIIKECGNTTIGACRYGVSTCLDGKWGICEGEIKPSKEICDGLDNDCDGLVDENLIRQCGTSDVGECEYGKSICDYGIWSSCAGNIDPLKEICDGLDNDCDGTIDDGCTCIEGQTKQCGANTGECEYGLQTCSGGVWGACLGGTLPKTEICDGKDNDCNGMIDEVCGNETI